MDLEIGNVIQLSDGLDYAVVQKIVVNKINYFYMITTNAPLQTIIVKQKDVDGEIVLETVVDEEELDYILYRIGQIVEHD